jgi:hypothetical protein
VKFEAMTSDAASMAPLLGSRSESRLPAVAG